LPIVSIFLDLVGYLLRNPLGDEPLLDGFVSQEANNVQDIDIGFITTNQVAITIADHTVSTTESKICYGLIEIYLIFKQSQYKEKVASAAVGKGRFMPINRA
jgi:hypothetical protein